eukprot:1160422-Pelagomonas_calceolata.AAC.15
MMHPKSHQQAPAVPSVVPSSHFKKRRAARLAEMCSGAGPAVCSTLPGNLPGRARVRTGPL